MLVDGGLRELSDKWLERFFRAMRTDVRRSAAGAYLIGLLDADPRKSLRAIAGRTSRVAYHQLHHFLSSGERRDDLVWREILCYANEYFERLPGCLVVEEIIIPKRGDRSAGVARQAIGAFNKQLNCQVVVSLAMVRGGHVIPIAMLLVPPVKASNSSVYNGAVGSKAKSMTPLSKSKIVGAAIDRLIKQGARIDYVYADESYFADAEFRRCLELHKLNWMKNIPSHEKVSVINDVVVDRMLSEVAAHEQVSGAILLDRKAELDKPPLYDSFIRDKPCFAANATMFLGCAANRGMIVNLKDKMQLVAELHNDGTECSYVTNLHVGLGIRPISTEISNHWRSKRAHLERVMN